MVEPSLFYVPREDATPEGKLATLAAVYAFILECHENRKAAEKTDGDEGGEAAEHKRAEGTAPEKRKQ